MYDEHEIKSQIQWPLEWIPGKPVPPRRHSRYKKARMKTIRCVHPKLKKIPKQNKLWHNILEEYNADRRFWLVDDEPHAEDTKEWHMLNDTIIPSVLLALERTCRLERIFQATKKNDGIFSFADSFVHFLLNENQSDIMHDVTPRNVPEIARALDIENLRYPEIPKHKIMSKNKAAKIIQKNVRGWLVRKQPDICEMREFWKVIREDKRKDFIRTDSTLIFNKNKLRVSPTDENFQKLFGEVLEEGSEPEVQEKKQYDWEEHEPKPCVPSPCEHFGLTDNILDTLTKPELEEAIRIYSLHPELQPSAMKTFLSRIAVKKDKLIEGESDLQSNTTKGSRNQDSIGNLVDDVKLNSVEK